MRSMTTGMLGLALLLAVPHGAAAQPPEPAAPGGDAAAPMRQRDRDDWRDQRREEIERRIRTVRIALITEELDLDEETAIKLAPLLNEWDAVQRRRGQRMRQIHDDLERMLADPKTPEVQVAAKMDEFWDMEEEALKERQDVFKDIGKVLSTEQQARLMLFVPKFRRQVHQLMRDWRDKDARPWGEGPPRDQERSWRSDQRPPPPPPERPGDEAPEDTWWAEPQR